MATEFKGVFPALVTPMTEDGQVDYRTLATFVDDLIEEGGVHGIIPLGSTGEYYALNAAERGGRHLGAESGPHRASPLPRPGAGRGTVGPDRVGG